MTRINFNIFKKRVEEGQYHFYDKPSEFCYFPFINEEIDMITLSNEINKYGQFLNHKESFIEREHVNDDTIGLHTIPENLETGDYISCKLQPTFYSIPETCFVVATTEQITQSYSTFNQLFHQYFYQLVQHYHF